MIGFLPVKLLIKGYSASVISLFKVANVDFNVNEIVSEITKAANNGVQIITFPELCLTGYTCGYLFNQEFLINKSLDGLKYILNNTSNLDIVSIVGSPIRVNNNLYNCALVLSKGKVLGVVPKTYITKNSDVLQGCVWKIDLNEIEKIEIYDTFIEGVKESIPMILNLFPTFLAMILAINLFVDLIFIINN